MIRTCVSPFLLRRLSSLRIPYTLKWTGEHTDPPQRHKRKTWDVYAFANWKQNAKINYTWWKLLCVTVDNKSLGLPAIFRNGFNPTPWNQMHKDAIPLTLFPSSSRPKDVVSIQNNINNKRSNHRRMTITSGEEHVFHTLMILCFVTLVSESAWSVRPRDDHVSRRRLRVYFSCFAYFQFSGWRTSQDYPRSFILLFFSFLSVMKNWS